MKTVRTFRIDNNLLGALEQISTEHGDITKHIEAALAAYKPIKQLMKAKPKEALQIPTGINTEAWKEWVEFRRKEKGNPVTKSGATKQFKLLLTYTEESQQEIIDTSINGGWTGLFPLKGGSNAAHQRNNKESFAERSINQTKEALAFTQNNQSCDIALAEDERTIPVSMGEQGGRDTH